MDFRHHSYVAGIREAETHLNREETPLIRYANETLRHSLGTDVDSFSHIDLPEAPLNGIASTNARSFAPVAAELLWHTREDARILFLGAGCGLECAEARSIRPRGFQSTVTLSPVDPRLKPRLAYEPMMRMAARLAMNDALVRKAPALAEKLREMDAVLPPSLLIQVDQMLPKPVFFEQVDEPYVDEQQVGWFPKEVHQRGRFDFVYDCCGPLHKMPANALFQSLEALQDSLSPDGIMFVDMLPSRKTAGCDVVFEIADHVTRGKEAAVDPDMGTLIIASRAKMMLLELHVLQGLEWQRIR